MASRFQLLDAEKKLIKLLCPEINNKSGIYLFYRDNEKNEKCFYVGQAKDLLNRTAQHLVCKKQHIDKSLYVHGTYREDNPNGWKLKVLYWCSPNNLDYWEQNYIDYFLKKGYKSYNVTGGGQFNKKKDIGERQQTKLKSYKNGKDLGYEKARKQVKQYFEKYLDYVIKDKTNKIKEKKLKEFEEFLGGTE